MKVLIPVKLQQVTHNLNHNKQAKIEKKMTQISRVCAISEDSKGSERNHKTGMHLQIVKKSVISRNWDMVVPGILL